MISFTSVQLAGWIATFLYPLARVLGFAAVAPVFNNLSVPRRVRLTMGLVIGLGIAPLVPPVTGVDINSGVGLWMVGREMLIGVAMGFAMRLVFAAVQVAGDQIGSQMGLGFAVFYDPLSTAQTPVVAEFLVLLATLVFLSINGHLMMIATLAQSFQVLPIAGDLLPAQSWLNLVLMTKTVFSMGLLLALPVTVALLITNLTLGVLNRAAPQLNLFAIGFPITITGGFILLMVTLNYLAVPLQRLFEEGLRMMLAFPG
jgi:flagellar biosynthetic protein FliR